jgi:hypothetical protein
MAPQTPSQDSALSAGLAPAGLSTGSAEPPAMQPAPSAKPFLCRKPVRITIYTCFVILFAVMLAWRFLPGLLDPTFEKHIQNKQVMVGMTREQVLQVWGSPYTINVSHTKDGIRREEWIYEDWKDASTVKHRYLYFEEGVLISGWYYQ